MATEVNSNYTALLTDEVILVDSTNNPVTITLPIVSPVGKRYYIKDKFGTTDINPITISAIPNQVDNNSGFTLTVDRQSILSHSDGTNWWII